MTLPLVDQPITCRDCASAFLFTIGEQEFYAQRGLTNVPQRCPTCRAARRQQREGIVGPAREMHQVTCSECGRIAMIPFAPRLDRPVYCSACFERVRTKA